jgi:hypothetical protein
MSVEVAAFSPVEELLAVTVAPGIRELPDFTTPEMEKVCPVSVSCPSAHTVTSMSIARRCSITNRVLDENLLPASAQCFMRHWTREFHTASIYSTLPVMLNG